MRGSKVKMIRARSTMRDAQYVAKHHTARIGNDGKLFTPTPTVMLAAYCGRKRYKNEKRAMK